jgi:hypothetical protein
VLRLCDRANGPLTVAGNNQNVIESLAMAYQHLPCMTDLWRCARSLALSLFRQLGEVAVQISMRRSNRYELPLSLCFTAHVGILPQLHDFDWALQGLFWSTRGIFVGGSRRYAATASVVTRGARRNSTMSMPGEHSSDPSRPVKQLLLPYDRGVLVQGQIASGPEVVARRSPATWNVAEIEAAFSSCGVSSNQFKAALLQFQGAATASPSSASAAPSQVAMEETNTVTYRYDGYMRLFHALLKETGCFPDIASITEWEAYLAACGRCRADVPDGRAKLQQLRSLLLAAEKASYAAWHATLSPEHIAANRGRWVYCTGGKVSDEQFDTHEAASIVAANHRVFAFPVVFVGEVGNPVGIDRAARAEGSN